MSKHGSQKILLEEEWFMRIVGGQARAQAGATVAQVSFSDSGGFGAVGASEYRGIPVFAPRGISYRPCEGDNLLVLPVDGTDTCAGVLSAPVALASGELRLSSSGGAEILLTQSGDVRINGVTITKDGEILSPEGR